ncbi:MAG: peptidylprolyl isomerase [Candidatus Brocadia sp.]|jgi:parvulin-like peptidyl-prolyl isomerase
MLRGLVKPLGVVLGGILCVHLSVSAAETDTKKPSAPPKKAKAAQKAQAGEAKEAASTGKQEGNSEKILATVNGENITQQEVDHILGRFGNQISEDQIPAVTEQILEGLITQKLILQFIRNNKIEPIQADIEAEINKVREDIKANPGLANQTLEQVLESHGSTIEDLKKDITISLSLEKYLGKDLDDQKIKAYFEKNKSAYDDTEVKASHILVDTRQMKSEAELTQAKEKINKIKAEVEAGKDFAEAAKQYSDCPSKEEGGDLGFFKRKGQMVEPFAAAAFELKVGQVSDPLQTQFGYHIIKVTEIKKGKDIDFNAIKPNVKQDILSEKARALIAQLRQNAKIDIKKPL